MSLITATDMRSSRPAAENTSIMLCFAGIFLVAVASFGLYFMLIRAPIQGEELERFLSPLTVSGPAARLETGSLLTNGFLPRILLDGLWRTAGGNVTWERFTALLLHVLAAVLTFLLIRTWLGKREYVLAPLTGALSLALSPAAAAEISQSAGLAVLLAAVFFLGACLWYLTAHSVAGRYAYPRILLAAWCVVAAAACHPIMAVTPVIVIALYPLRRWNHEPLCEVHGYLSVFVLLAAGLCAAIVLLVNGRSFAPDTAYAPYFLSVAGALAIGRIAGCDLPGPAKKGFMALVALLLLCFCVISFVWAARYADPVNALEAAYEANPEGSSTRQLALQYYEEALQQENTEARADFVRQALATGPEKLKGAGHPAWEDLLWAKALMETGNPQPSADMAYSALTRAPFTETGSAAARLRAACLDEKSGAVEIASLLAFTGRGSAPLAEDALRHARALTRLGDLENAGNILATLPEFAEDTPEAQLQHQVKDVINRAHGLENTYREKIAKNPQDSSAYIALAESNILVGKDLRAFYFLELALRKSPNNQEAWEMLGLIFAKKNQPEHFIERWGNLRAEKADEWFTLARRVARAGMWNAAFVYSGLCVKDAVLSAEEYVAGFAVEARRPEIAREWLVRAVEAHPNSYNPRLLLADLAIAEGDFEGARRYLEEASRLQAPEAELAKRREKLVESAPGVSGRQEVLEPGRTYIQ